MFKKQKFSLLVGEGPHILVGRVHMAVAVVKEVHIYDRIFKKH